MPQNLFEFAKKDKKSGQERLVGSAVMSVHKVYGKFTLKKLSKKFQTLQEN